MKPIGIVLPWALVLLIASLPQSARGETNQSQTDPCSAVQDLRSTAAALSLELAGGPTLQAVEALAQSAAEAEAALEALARQSTIALADQGNLADQPSAEGTVNYDVSKNEVVVGTFDSVDPELPVTCSTVAARMNQARIESRILTSLIHQLMLLIDHGALPDGAVAMLLDQVRQLAARMEDTYPAVWDAKTFTITRHWARPAPPQQLDDEHCNEINFAAYQPWTDVQPATVLWHGRAWTKDSLPPGMTITVGADAVDLVEQASLTTVCLEPRHVQLRAKLAAPAATSPLAPVRPGTNLVLRSARGPG